MTLQQIERERLLAARRGHAQHGRPAAAGLEQLDGRRRREVTSERREVVRDARANLVAHHRAAGEDRRQRRLDRRPDGQERVADQLEAVEEIARVAIGTGHRHPCQLQLRQPDGLRQAAERHREARRVGEDRRRVPGRGGQPIVHEHLVGDERQPVRGAAGRQGPDVGGRQDRAGRVVRAHHDDGARPGGDPGGDGAGVVAPAAVRIERIGHGPHRLEPAQDLEERVARDRDEDFVAGIAQHLEQERVRLARAGGQDDPARIDRRSVAGELGADRRAGGEEAPRIGCVVETGPAGERPEEVVRVAQAGASRVGAGQVDQRNSLILQGIPRHREPVEGESGDPVRPRHECYNTALPAGDPGIARPGSRSLDDVDQDGPRLARPRVRGDGRVYRGADEPHFPWGRSFARRQRLDRVDHQRDHQQRQHAPRRRRPAR